MIFVLTTLIRVAVSTLALRLSEPGATISGFLFGVFGYGILREWGAGPRSWVPDDRGAVVTGRRRARRR